MSSLRRAEQLYKQDALYDTIKQQFSNEFDKYVDETIALDAQARYNQGKLIFEVASLFVGIGEIKGLLNTGKITSETFQVLQKIPPSMVQFLKSATKFSKDAVLKLENATGKLLLDGQHIVTITKQKLIIAKGALIESIDDNLKPIGELVTPDGYTLSMSDGRSLNERVLNIVEDARGKYKVAVAKVGDRISSEIDDFIALAPKIEKIKVSELPEGYEIFVKNGSKYIRRVNSSNKNTPRLMVDETGTIVKYTKPQRLASNGKLRANLAKVLGEIPPNHQAHHIVPSNVVEKSPIFKEAVKRGLYDVDRTSNGKLLAETAEDFALISEAYPTHFGSHPKYDNVIIAKIEDIIEVNDIDIFELKDLTDTKLNNIINAIENIATDVLINWESAKLN